MDAGVLSLAEQLAGQLGVVVVVGVLLHVGPSTPHTAGEKQNGTENVFLRFSSRVPPRFPGHAGGAEEWETYQPEQGNRDKIHSTPPTKMMRDMRIILLWYFD